MFDRLATLVLVACVFENLVLAIVNANAFSMSQDTVALVQLVLTATAAVLAFVRTPRVTPQFYWAGYAFATLCLIATWRSGDTDFRFLYNASIIPLFILVGSSLDRFPLEAVWAMVGVVLVVAGIELLWPDAYVRTVNPLGYYLDTRDWVQGQFADQTIDDPGLYVGAQRPDGFTFFNVFSTYRLGSVFMEPLSLGYFGVIVSIIANVFVRARVARYLLLALCLLFAVLSDSRLAIFCIAAIFVVWPLAKFMPTRYVLIPPLVVLAALIVIAATTGGAVGSGELAGRLAITVAALQDANFGDILFGGMDATRSGDSAIVAIVSNAGILAVPLLLALSSGLLSTRRPDNSLNWSAFIYVLSASLFGGALFSIKTAPLLGMLVGYAGAHLTPRQAPARNSD